MRFLAVILPVPTIAQSKYIFRINQSPGDKTLTSCSWPRFRVDMDHSHPYTPISVMCEGPAEAASVMRLQQAIRERENLPLDLTADEISAVAEEARVLRHRKRFWAVVNGNSATATIYLTW